MKNLFAVALACLVIPTAAVADPISAFTLFGGTKTTLGSTVIINSGLVGANGTVVVGNGSDTLVLTGAGILNAGSTVELTAGSDIIFNGNVVIGNGSGITGDIDSGGNVNIGSTVTVTGSIRAAGTVVLGNGTVVNGDVDAGFAGPGVAVNLGNSTTKVLGTVNHKTGTTVSLNGGSVFANVIGTPDAPIPYIATSLPGATSFAAGTTNFGGGENGQLRTLTPSSGLAAQYNVVNFGSTNTVNMTAGTYFFNTFTLGNGSFLNLDVSAGNILMYFAGLVNIGSSLTVNVNGGGNASDIYAETTGNFILGNGSQWRGTVFGSGLGSDITFGSTTNLIGALYATDLLEIGNGSNVTLMQSDVIAGPISTAAVPEPGSLILLGTGLLTLVRFRRTRRQAKALTDQSL